MIIVTVVGVGTAGRVQTFYVYSPPRHCSAGRYHDHRYRRGRWDGRTTMRVILAIHGYTGQPLQEVAKWRGAAGDLGAIVIAPAGTLTSGEPGLGWNGIHCCSDPVRGAVDNLDFVVRGGGGCVLGRS